MPRLLAWGFMLSCISLQCSGYDIRCCRSTEMQSSTRRPPSDGDSQSHGWQIVGTHDADNSHMKTVAHRPVADNEIARLRVQAGDLTRPPTSLLQHSARQLLHRHQTWSSRPDTAETRPPTRSTDAGGNSAAAPGLGKSCETTHETSPVIKHETSAASSHLALSEWELL